jgi:hydrogenase-1 operon protein HyaF
MSASAPVLHPPRVQPLPAAAGAAMPRWRLPDRPAQRQAVLDVLQRVLLALEQRRAGGEPGPIGLSALDAEGCGVLADLLGEGEVEARVEARADGEGGLQARESAFAGVWRVWRTLPDGDGAGPGMVDVGAVPRGLLEAARLDAPALPARADAGRAAPTPASTSARVAVPAAGGASSLLEQLHERSRAWRPGAAAHVVNLTSLAWDTRARAELDARLGCGRVRVEVRRQASGRGDGGIAGSVANTRLPRTWRVSYLRADGGVALDTLEVTGMPEVACAGAADFDDSAERLREVLEWMRAS